jgi:DNA-binding transcriptional MerR regulator
VEGWSAAEVARASGVSVPTLRAWERSGLLVPGTASDDGYRAYGRDDLVRLQRVLLLRTLGVPDDAVPAALEHTPDAHAALRMHLDVLEAERERLGRQAGALRATLDGLADTGLADTGLADTGQGVDPAAMFDGFDDPEPADGSDELAELGAAWARLWAAGEPVDGEAARTLIGRHRALAGPEVSPRLAEVLDHHAPGTAAYARDALGCASRS